MDSVLRGSGESAVNTPLRCRAYMAQHGRSLLPTGTTDLNALEAYLEQVSATPSALAHTLAEAPFPVVWRTDRQSNYTLAARQVVA